MRQFLSTPRGLTILEILGVIVISSHPLEWRLAAFPGRYAVLSPWFARRQDGAGSPHPGAHGDTGCPTCDGGACTVWHSWDRPQPPTPNTAGHQGDRLAMLTLPAPVAPPEGAQHSSVPQRIRYVLNAMPDSKTLALQRAVDTPREPQRERVMVVHEHMQEFSVRYFDGQTWYAEWQRAELPQAVEITLIVQSAGAQARGSRFATLVTAD